MADFSGSSSDPSGSLVPDETRRSVARMARSAKEAAHDFVSDGLEKWDGDRSLVSKKTDRDVMRAVGAVQQGVKDLVNDGLEDWDAEEFKVALPSAIDGVLDKLTHASKAQQITAGGVSGWVTGYLFNKIGRPVLYLAGGALIIGLFAEHQGYLKLDWSKIRDDVSTGRRVISDRISTGALARKNGRPWLHKLKVLAQSSPFLSGGFLGGILLGLAS